ncbi:MAG: GNAT family N-acetyltransferase [Ruminococcus sp.]
MYAFVSVQAPDMIQKLAALANEIWHEYFPCLLTEAQIDYMVEKFQSEEALTKQIAEGYQYYIFPYQDEPAGYFGVCPQSDGSLFLSKLYLKQAYRGKGLASVLFREVQDIARASGASSVWLTVNKHNDQAIAVYRHFGMEIIRSQVTDIGSGFVMDDYVFSVPVRQGMPG